MNPPTNTERGRVTADQALILEALDRIVDNAGLPSDLNDIRAFIRSARAPQPSVSAAEGEGVKAPDGWALVPVEPTLQMLAAGCDASRTVSQNYRAMLAAAPQTQEPTK